MSRSLSAGLGQQLSPAVGCVIRVAIDRVIAADILVHKNVTDRRSKPKIVGAGAPEEPKRYSPRLSMIAVCVATSRRRCR